MGYRDFRDASGISWMAWDVVPNLVERRQGPRRQSPATHGSGTDTDRRIGIDRRMVRSTRARPDDSMDGGWLCFESTQEKRRLAPIPADWMRCADRELAAYCQRASLVRERPSSAQSQRAFPGEDKSAQQQGERL